ncbi:MAG TPA: sensor histidine kinase [Solirubrobacteraceae bacterium]|nr:sensor histidine kinase [Solirubrobacteraceae bacterium]
MPGRARATIEVSVAQGANPRRWMPALAAGLSIGEYARSLVRRLAFLVAALLAGIWALDGQGYFWPAWAWLGLGVLVLIEAGAGWAWTRPPGAVRRVACVWTIVGVAAVILVFTWLLTWLLAGARSFWPAWALLSLASAGSAYSLIALHDRVLVAHGRRALRARIDMLTRTRRQAVDAQAAELRRIERDLHDGVQARLVALTLQLGRAELRVDDQPEIRELILDAQREAHHAIAELRDLARGLVPPLLADRGLVAAVESLAARYGLGTAIEADTRRSLAPAVESAAYFVIAEALTNSAKHAHASRTWVQLRDEQRELAVVVGDDGRGGADPHGSGLAGLRARVEALDGSLRVHSAAGAGTVLEARLPCG